MTIRFSSAVRNLLLSAIATAADTGSGNATLKVYSGSQPAGPDTAPTGTLLATFTLTDPVFETPSAGAMPMDADPDLTTTAVATGTAGWARLADATGTAVMDGTVGTGGDFVINTTSITNGQTITLTSAVLNYPA
jgi:hypothetical protein